MAAWPATLPQIPLHAGLTQSGKANLLRSVMEMGPDKVRRRTTAAVRPMAVSFVLTQAQKATFETFVESTLGGGVERFDLPNVRGGGSLHVVRMARGDGSPVYDMVPVGTRWQVSFDLEIMPT